MEKTPGHEHEADRILAAYPRARFVHVVRDPRSVAAAIVRLDRATDRSTDVLDVGLTVRRSFEAAERNRRSLGERYLVLRYEELVAEPEATMRRVAGLAGLDWVDSLLTPTVGGEAATSNSAWSARRVTGEIESRRLDLWRNELDGRSLDLVAARDGSGRASVRLRPAAPGTAIARDAWAARRARNAIGSRVQESVQEKTVSSATSP